ncbi:MAG: T9SS type A sorting domain-containing protein [Bacteroidales bacterium]|nr:T9SS type A sorting domain-containing protein [Bacteroidales bacterium]MCF8455044.1 T9SS type A sorting domain-containing protein [Bacteroidales bacterium]
MKVSGKLSGIILFFAILFISGSLSAQLIASDPPFPTDDQSVVITFNAALGSAGLAGYTGDVYAHTGVITNNSTGPGDWKYVVTNWGQNTPETKLTNIGGDMYTLEIGPTIRSYYGVPAGETILQMAFVFRSGVQVGGNWLEGKTDSGGDIFVNVYDEGLNVSFITPDQSHYIVDMSDQINVQIEASLSDSVALYKGNTLVSKVSGTQLQSTVTVDATGKTWLVAKAWNVTEVDYDSTYYFVVPPVVTENPPAGIEYGINYIDDETVVLCLHAPNKEFVFAGGDFSNWELEEEYLMKRNTAGDIYWIEIDSVIPGKEYVFQYLIDDEILTGDPYTEKVSDPWDDKWIPESSYPDLIEYPTDPSFGIASVFQTAQDEYSWNYINFTPPEKGDLVIYELLIRDFTDESNYQTLIDSLTYLKYLGVNAIELMPVMEFGGNSSWGYNPSFYFAPDKYYGPKNKLKELIDSCHISGMAVILDVVWNHAQDVNPMARLYWDVANNEVATNNPWFNATCPHEPWCWFHDWNHESVYTQQFVDRANKFWLEEYNIDGFRFDFTKGLTNTIGEGWNYDASRIAIVKRMSDAIWDVNPDAYVILEHWTDNTEEKELANYGCMLWGNMTYDYQEAAMGYPSNFSWGYYANRGWNSPHLVTYMESHDEERLMYKNIEYGASSGYYSTKVLATALDRMALAANFFFPIPGPKMIWQFGELGYDISIDFNGRTGEKPTHWEYFDIPDRNHLFHVYKALIHLKKTYPVFSSTDFLYSLTSNFKRINLTDPSMNVTIIGNFDVNAGVVSPKFQHTGWWYEYWTGDSINVSDVNANINLVAGEYKFYTDVKLPQPVLEFIGIEEIENSKELQGMVYPNPSNGDFTILIGGMKPGKLNVEIFNFAGQRVWQQETSTHGERYRTIPWNGSEATPGIYFCRISNDGRMQNLRLVKL